MREKKQTYSSKRELFAWRAVPAFSNRSMREWPIPSQNRHFTCAHSEIPVSFPSVFCGVRKADTISPYSPYKGEAKTENQEKKLLHGDYTLEQKIKIAKWCIEHDRDYHAAARKSGCTFSMVYRLRFTA